jgi:hypothetical protein
MGMGMGMGGGGKGKGKGKAKGPPKAGACLHACMCTCLHRSRQLHALKRIGELCGARPSPQAPHLTNPYFLN